MLRILGLLVIAVLLATEVKAEGYPLDYWARRAAVGNIELSPDGSKFALLRILERGGNPIIEIYETDNLDKEPRRIDSNPMEITTLGGWITDDTLIFSARQQVRDQIEGWNEGTYEYKNAIYDYSKTSWAKYASPILASVDYCQTSLTKYLYPL